MAEGVTFDTRKPVDFVIVGSGSAGGILARELSMARFNVVVLEQGPHRQAASFTHDEISVMLRNELLGGGTEASGQTFRSDPDQEAVLTPTPPAQYAQLVGGSSVHFSGNFWRLRPYDFKERTRLGPVSGTTFADWPIDYAELEPFYTKVDWDIGVSGAPGPFDGPRSKPFPMPPMPVKSSGVILEKAALKLGLHPQAAPLAILTQPHGNRPACINCGFCMGFGCEVNAKSSSLVTMIPQAEASGHCEIRSRCAAFRIETDAQGRASEVLYYGPDGKERGQKTRAVIVSANGAETPRLLLMSASSRHPDGLANSSGFVGKNLMFNNHGVAFATFEHELNDYKGVQCTRIVHDFYETDQKRGFYGGGGIDARPLFSATPILHALYGAPPNVPRWGAGYKSAVVNNFSRQMCLLGSTTSLALERNSITLDPTHKDRWGRPALRVTYLDHPDDLATARFLQDRAMELFDAAGARQSWRLPVEHATNSPHLLGTCRMGNDPKTSVIDRYHRAHDVPNLFLCDGSSFVTSGRGQPTMTIMALAFRAADHIKQAARRGEV
jgi:choline dehydrogenase-like flavoprotein